MIYAYGRTRIDVCYPFKAILNVKVVAVGDALNEIVTLDQAQSRVQYRTLYVPMSKIHVYI